MLCKHGLRIAVTLTVSRYDTGATLPSLVTLEALAALFNETAHGDFWFEADVEFLTDPSARKYIGLWMTTGNGSEGYRFAHLDGAWVVTRWNSGFGDGAAVTGGVDDGGRIQLVDATH